MSNSISNIVREIVPAPMAWVLAAFACLMADGAQAGNQDVIVEFAAGSVQVQSADGQFHPVQAGDSLSPGQTIVTGQGRVQIRFSDNGVIDLAPESAFRVDQYNYAGTEDGTERKFMTLLGGMLRTISGAIGHMHLETYRLDTPVASIGIRGTGYTAQYSNGLMVEVGEGAIEVVNQAGSLRVDRGQAGFVRDSLSPPVLTPRLNRAGNIDGTTGPVNGPSPEDARKSASAAPNSNTAPGSTTAGSTTVAQIGMDGTSAQPARVDGPESGTGAQTPPTGNSKNGKTATTTSAVVVNDAGNGIGWSRWTSADGRSISLLLTGTPNISLPVNGSATYTIDGGTGPIYANSAGTGQSGRASGSLTVNFAGLRSTLGLDMNFAMDDGANYHIASTAQGNSSITLGADGVFSGDKLAVTATGQNNACAQTKCQGSVMGFFAGSAAERAALAYGIATLPDPKLDVSTAQMPATGTKVVLTGVSTFGKVGPNVSNVSSTLPTIPTVH